MAARQNPREKSTRGSGESQVAIDEGAGNPRLGEESRTDACTADVSHDVYREVVWVKRVWVRKEFFDRETSVHWGDWTPSRCRVGDSSISRRRVTSGRIHSGERAESRRGCWPLASNVEPVRLQRRGRRALGQGEIDPIQGWLTPCRDRIGSVVRARECRHESKNETHVR